MSFSNKYQPAIEEQRWQDFWEAQKVYQYNAESTSQPFIVDTPPPTVSGSLHIGHVFSYTQTDIIARQQRMQGKNVFYPMGYDDNGLPTERRVQNYFGIKCNPKLPYQENWQPRTDFNPKKDQFEEVSRRNFIEACNQLTIQDEKAYENMWKRLGLSIDWNETYATIDKHCQKISQLSFLDLVNKKQVYHAKTPTMWDIDFQSAIAQAELEEKEIGGAYHDIQFDLENGQDSFVISTTRPELLAACIAVVAHPEDERYQKYFNQFAVTPLFHARVPVLPSEHAEPDKGTGIMMVCTFGDIADVEYWQKSDLPIKQIIDKSGHLMPVDFTADPFLSLQPELASKNYAALEGIYVKKARKVIAELLATDTSNVQGNAPALVAEPKEIQHPVKFYEKGDRPLEFVPTRQWYIKTIEHQEKLIEQGKAINWHPEYMYTRYENWVNGLNQDWCISRQRFFGVPFPVWYEIDASGQTDFSKPIFAKAEQLPVDPMIDLPEGFSEDQRDQSNGFTADIDVMDTWATSSMTPQLSSHWGIDQERHEQLFPCSIRPQAHEIIRTWAFYTIVKSWMHEGKIPWENIVISGWVLDPDRKKMSKSKGNVVTPESLFDQYSADAIRYLAGRAKLGGDTAVDEAVFKNGGKLITKLYNASKFVAMQFERIDLSIQSTDLSDVNCELDRALCHKISKTIELCSKAFENFDYATALRLTEDCFWDFCDNYLELVKSRSYQDSDTAERKSAYATLAWALQSFLKLFAPTLPFVTEAIWKETFATDDTDSIHNSVWPQAINKDQVVVPEYAESYDLATEVIAKVRGYKTKAQKSLKWEVAKLEIACTADKAKAIQTVQEDLLNAGNIIAEGLSFTDTSSDITEVTVTLNENWSK